MFRLTPTVKNLLIINVAVFLADMLLRSIPINNIMAMYRLGSAFFEPYQIFTYMFAHAGFSHILFNMLGLVMLGTSLEMVWGPRKFLVFYLVTGMGAGIFYAGIGYFQTSALKSDLANYRSAPSVEAFTDMVIEHKREFSGLVSSDGSSIMSFISAYEKNPEGLRSQSVEMTYDIERVLVTEYPGRVIGASGAVYGILMAFGLLFPERQLMLLFPPIPIKAKYFVLILGGLAIYMGLMDNPGDPVAHLVHLGGMVFGFIMVRFF